MYVLVDLAKSCGICISPLKEPKLKTADFANSVDSYEADHNGETARNEVSRLEAARLRDYTRKCRMFARLPIAFVSATFFPKIFRRLRDFYTGTCTYKWVD